MENKFDKNYIIGLVIMFLMFGVYLTFFSPEPPAEKPLEPAKKTITTEERPAIVNNPAIDSTLANAPEKEVVIENKDLRVTFSSRGGKIKQVALKNYKTYKDYIGGKDKEMVLFDGTNSSLNFELPTQNGALNLSDINFATDAVSGTVAEGKSQTIVFTTNLGEGTLQKTYLISDKGFGIQHDITAQNLQKVLKDAPTILRWENQIQVLENDLEENRKASQINFFDNEENFENIGANSLSNEKEDAELPVKWFSFYQRYFTSGIVSENSFFQNAKFTLNVPTQDTSVVKVGMATAEIPYADLIGNKTQFKYYFGPNEMADLKVIGHDFQKNLYLGYDIVKPINKFIFVPLFTWVESFVSNYGLLIIIVVLIIKLALTPLIYKSYMSSAKMRVLAPEINAIKEKVGDDAVKVQQETMKLYQQVGVNPLSGCIPLLLQMPILMSVFFLFPNLTMFRQKEFLWAKDLSTYDDLISWGFNLPILGSHLSLFVILMTLSSLAFTYYNNQTTPDQPGPIDMKKISYIFPVVFLFVLNSFPAALSFYYLVSNLVTILQQQIVKRFVNEEKILTILENNKRNYHSQPKKKNKFSDFLEKQMQASEEMKKKTEEMKKQQNKRKK
jgi:YidC/Oxa1 family membrane protein insertase